MAAAAGASGVDVLIAATMRRWVADELAAGPVPVVHDFGLDAPTLPAGLRTAWWTPTEHAARLLRAGVPLQLAAPGPHWLADIPAHLRGRGMWAGTLTDLTAALAVGDVPPAGWAKPAEAKVDGLPAAWFDDLTGFVTAAAAHMPGTAWVQVCPERLRLAEEHRFFVTDGAVLAGSPYLTGDGATWSDGFAERDDVDCTSAAAFARDTVAALGAGQPDAYVLDVARTDAGRWLVLEANPAWSSAFYGAPVDGVVTTVVAASSRDRTSSGWAWQPDPYLLAYAARRPVLPVREPLWLARLRRS